jgi:hypothetical protein
MRGIERLRAITPSCGVWHLVSNARRLKLYVCLRRAVLGGQLRARGFEIDDRLSGLRVAELFAGQAFDRFWVLPEIAYDPFEPLLFLFLGTHLVFEHQDLLAQPFIVLEYRQIPKEDTEQARHNNQRDHKVSETLPDTKIYLLAQIRAYLTGNDAIESIRIH